jgi:hypothetical protein
VLRKLRPRSIYDVFALLALIVAVGGTSAYAANTVFSTDIVNGEVKSVDIGDGEVGSADVKDNSINTFDVHSFLGVDVVDDTLTGADVNESTLGTVPSSVLGGLGRNGVRQNGEIAPGSCDPESSTFINCDIGATLTLSRPARVLVIGSIAALLDAAASSGNGSCQLGTTSGAIPGTTTPISVADGTVEQVAISGVTGVFPAGQHAFGIDCNELGFIRFTQARVTAVALSDQ